jgi:hypothetical protein
MHVHRQCGSVRVVTEPALFAHAFREGETPPAELARHGEGQVARLAKLVEVLLKEAVVPVIARRTLAKAL